MPSLNVAFIKANWHSDIVSRAQSGFQQELDRQQVDYSLDSWDVPGAFEMPLLAQKLAKADAMMPSCAPRWWSMAVSIAMTLSPRPWSAV